jgi:hypothetical protein
MRVNLEERKEESRSLRRQFDSVTEYVDILTEFLEKLRDKTAGYEYAICGGGQPNTANASI